MCIMFKLSGGRIMLNLVKGHRVSLVENLFESFTKLTEHHLTANVHAEKILEVFQLRMFIILMVVQERNA